MFPAKRYGLIHKNLSFGSGNQDVRIDPERKGPEFLNAGNVLQGFAFQDDV